MVNSLEEFGMNSFRGPFLAGNNDLLVLTFVSSVFLNTVLVTFTSPWPTTWISSLRKERFILTHTPQIKFTVVGKYQGLHAWWWELATWNVL